MTHGAPHILAQLVSSTLLCNHITGKTPPKYTDFTILEQLFTEYRVVSARNDSSMKTGKDLVAR